MELVELLEVIANVLKPDHSGREQFVSFGISILQHFRRFEAICQNGGSSFTFMLFDAVQKYALGSRQFSGSKRAMITPGM